MEKKKRGRPPGSRNRKKTGPSASAPKDEKKRISPRLRDEIWAIALMGTGAFLAVALQTEAAGQFGVALGILFKGCFGWTAYLLPYYLILYGFLLFGKKMAHMTGRSAFFLLLVFLCMTVINAAWFFSADLAGQFSFAFMKEAFDQGAGLESGGLVGMVLGFGLVRSIGKVGLFILCGLLILIALLLLINTPISQFFDKLKDQREAARERRAERVAGEAAADDALSADPAAADRHGQEWDLSEPPKQAVSGKQMKILDYMKDDSLFEKKETENPKFEEYKESLIEEKQEATKTAPPNKKTSADEIAIVPAEVTASFKLPSLELLDKNPVDPRRNSNENLKAKAEILEKTLQNFGVSAKVIQVTKGPAVTRYEIQPSVGVKVSSIVRLADDIALNLEAKSIRIEAPIPGKAAVGIEVENERVNLVTIREMFESPEFRNAKSKISFIAGKDIAGNPIIADLKEMPHLLIAGSTGSGKSVCINSIIVSMLFKSKPDEVKFLLIDPKVVELNNYNGIPHLLIPVVTDPTKASAALNWAVQEMTARYKKFAEAGVRDLENFNARMKAEGTVPLPQIVIIIDELADLMMAAPAQVEESICRLAQMARAAGMHLIVATQRPSVDVITGVIKANIPSRVAFAVSSQFDSRTILDMAGAERLVGKGDMLFNPLGMSKPIRVQGAFISDPEVHKVIDFLRAQTSEAAYSEDIISSIERSKSDFSSDDEDELLKDAIETVVAAEQASVSMLQRRFRIGYNRAARLVDMMEERGIVSAPDGSRPRKVLISRDEFEELERLDE